MLIGDVSEAAMEKWLKPTFLRLEPRLELKSGGLDGKESACNMGDLCLTPGLGRSPEGGHGKPLQYSCLEKSMDRGAWQASSPRGCKESDTTEQLHFHFLS